MRDSLVRWIRDADAVRHLEHFRVEEPPLDLAPVRSQADDYYVALVGELFEAMRTESNTSDDWARLANALAHFGVEDGDSPFTSAAISQVEATLYSAAAFYYGGFPASAYITARAQQTAGMEPTDSTATCFDFLARPVVMTSQLGETVREALRLGNMRGLEELAVAAEADANEALAVGPEEWIPARLVEKLLGRFLQTNLRAVLPDGGSDFWTPLVTSLIERFSWEFFPSQIEAIRRGLLDSPDTFSLQMPTGSGKTALCETLLYRHVMTTTETVAVLLVPYRSLASELRGSLVKRLNLMGISTRCAYGGTVPTGAEVQDLDEVRVMVATPEALSGVLSAEPLFFRRISLVICDEGHLLDSPGRGVSLELLLARLRARDGGAPRFVFVSAIVPNIEEINSWLGGGTDSVVQSEYRPAIAEFAVLRPTGTGARQSISLEMHPHEDERMRFHITNFLRRQDFLWWNVATNRVNTYGFGSVKTRAIATARKVLPMGAVAVFAANKRGHQGAMGLAEELIRQVEQGLPLPEPAAFANGRNVARATDYLEREYGANWVGTRALKAGAVLHHGDIPQETREVLEALLRSGAIRLAICTTTLAEGVNLPIRTLILYSVQRRTASGRPKNMWARDIKNLAGRAGRAGATTKGLVICANEEQWPVVEPAAKQLPGERVRGALQSLMKWLVGALRAQNVTLSNEVLESSPVVHALIDGVDSTLIDLAGEELGEDELVGIAIRVADDTFASSQATTEESRQLLRDVFEFRARRIVDVRTRGRLGWIRDTGARVRLLESVERDLLPLRDAWDSVVDPIEQGFVETVLEWAWRQADLRNAVRDAYRLKEGVGTDSVRGQFVEVVKLWLAGAPFAAISGAVNVRIDDLLGVYTRAVGFVLQTLAEQATALLERLVESQGREVSEAVRQFPEHLRFGVPTAGARMLAAHGLRHRRAAVELGGTIPERRLVGDRVMVFRVVRDVLESDRGEWEGRLGPLVFERTLQDLS